jgi:hypothetical protein
MRHGIKFEIIVTRYVMKLYDEAKLKLEEVKA